MYSAGDIKVVASHGSSIAEISPADGRSHGLSISSTFPLAWTTRYLTEDAVVIKLRSNSNKSIVDKDLIKWSKEDININNSDYHDEINYLIENFKKDRALIVEEFKRNVKPYKDIKNQNLKDIKSLYSKKRREIKKKYGIKNKNNILPKKEIKDLNNK